MKKFMLKIVRRVMRLVIYGVIILTVLYFSLNIIMNIIVHRGGKVTIPNLVGIDFEQAYEQLFDLKLYLQREAEQFNSQIPENAVVSQRPLPGTVVKPGRVVKVIISLGSEIVVVPDLSGKSLRQAEVLLRQAGLVVGEQTRIYSTDVQLDNIIIQNPRQLAEVDKGTTVNLVISDGPLAYDAVMPNFLGTHISYAEEIVEIMGLNVGNIVTQIDASLKDGTIIEQEPSPNKPIDDTVTVNFLISSQTSQKTSSVTSHKIIHFEVSQGLSSKHIRIIVLDEEGEREVYNRNQAPGSKVDIPVSVRGQAKAKIYVNDILVEERDL